MKEIEEGNVNNDVVVQKKEPRMANKENWKRWSDLMPEGRQNPNLNNSEKIEISSFTLKQTFKV